MSYILQCYPISAYCRPTLFLYLSVFAYMLCGAALITIGTLYEFDLYLQQQLLLVNQTLPTKLLIPVGVFMVSVSIIGYWGDKKNDPVLLLVYVCIAAILLIFSLGCFVIILVNYDKIADDVIDKMQENQENYVTDRMARLYWDGYHAAHQCCGIYRPSDWLEHEQNVPYSCCQAYREDQEEVNMYCAEENNAKPFLRTTGCLAKLEIAYGTYWTIMLCTASITSVIQVEGIIVSIYMAILFWKLQQEIKDAYEIAYQAEEIQKDIIIDDETSETTFVNKFGFK